MYIYFLLLGEKYRLLCRLLNDPYDVMGCWCSDNYFISGTMEWNYNSFDASVWLCSPPAFKNKKESLDTDSKTNLKEGVSSENPSLENALEYLGHSEHSVVVSWYKKQLLKFRNLQVC